MSQMVMSQGWRYQLRVYLDETLAERARRHPDATDLAPLTVVLAAHDARMVSQLDSFEAYVEQAEATGPENFPLYRWTRATLDDAEKRRKHLKAFALRVAGQEVYAAQIADALEADLRKLVGGGIVERISRHDTNPANNLPVPAEYR